MNQILHTILLRTVVLVFALSFMRCNKVNDIIRDLRDCEVSQYNYSIIQNSAPHLYKKYYDQSGKFVEQIDFTFLAVGVPEIKHWLVRHSQKKLLFIDKDNPNDTTMIVQFNANARPETITTSVSSFNLPIKFFYKNNRLDSIRFPDPFGTLECEYDHKGNILAIKQFQLAHGQDVGTFYEYDYSRKIKMQVYHEEAVAALHFPFVVLQYIDLFPELDPKNVRIRSRVGLRVGSHISDFILFNHMMDAEGKLAGYEIRTATDPSVAFVNIDWKCNKDNNNHSQ
ncbi:MAG TPA: hypothetical protein VEV87_02590 [Chitinophagaceae bacterium]|nr:hypothetical protein [Chitinophagaceae bacterium]